MTHKIITDPVTDDKPMTVDALMKLATDYAHCYAFVGDDTMPRRQAELRAAIEQYGLEQRRIGLALQRLPSRRGSAKPVAWVRDLVSPQPHCVTSLLYRSKSDADAGTWYAPLYTADQMREAIAAERDRLEHYSDSALDVVLDALPAVGAA